MSSRLGFSLERMACVPVSYTHLDVYKRQADVQQKTELTLACFSLDYNLRSQIVKFNQTSTDCRIVVRDYAEYADGEDYYCLLYTSRCV